MPLSKVHFAIPEMGIVTSAFYFQTLIKLVEVFMNITLVSLLLRFFDKFVGVCNIQVVNKEIGSGFRNGYSTVFRTILGGNLM